MIGVWVNFAGVAVGGLIGTLLRGGILKKYQTSINQPRQKFICEAMRNPEFDNLVDAAWALIGHELSATQNLAQGMFSAETLAKMPSLDARIEYFKNYALQNAVKN